MVRQALCAAGLLLAALCPALAQEEAPPRPAGSLELVATFPREDLGAPTSVAVSPDGKFLYASAWESATHVVFRIDETTGRLEHVQTINDPDLLRGATGLQLSPDSRWAAAAAFQSKAVVLYRRKLVTGKLTKVDSQRQGEKGVTGLTMAIDAVFAPDGKFLYVLESNGGLTSFRIAGTPEARRLEFLEENHSEAFLGIRGLAIHPSGTPAFAACYLSDSLVLADLDPMSGISKIRQVIRNGEGEVRGLDGAFGVAVSPDGRFVYTVAGRFEGVDAFGVYAYDGDRNATSLVQEIAAGAGAPGENPLQAFQGGNDIVVSPDGRHVYAVATKSGALAAFSRDEATGRLESIEVRQGGEELLGAAGVALSPDGRFVFVAAEFRGAVTVFRRHD